jgi:hypothetical protein
VGGLLLLVRPLLRRAEAVAGVPSGAWAAKGQPLVRRVGVVLLPAWYWDWLAGRLLQRQVRSKAPILRLLLVQRWLLWPRRPR